MKVKSKKNISLMPKYRFMGFIWIEILDSNKCYLVEIDHIWDGGKNHRKLRFRSPFLHLRS